MGEIQKAEYSEFNDARWYEKIAAVSLLIGIVGIGIAPLWLSDMILESLDPIISRLTY